MLKSIRLKYQSHRDTFIKFAPGVTAIVGTSGHGKTAILRALRWVLFNRPKGKRFIPNFAGDEALVEIELDDAFISHRKGKTAAYRLNDKVFRKYGVRVPEDIANAANFGDTNIQDQLSQHFLVTQSPSEVAKTLNKITNEDRFDKWTKELKRRKTKANSRRTYLLEEDEKTDAKLERFERLDEAVSHFDTAQQAATKMESLERQLEDILAICDSIQASEVSPKTLQLFKDSEWRFGMASASHNDVASATRIKADADRMLAAIAIVDKAPALEEASKLLDQVETDHDRWLTSSLAQEEMLKLAKEIAERGGTLDESAIMLDNRISEYIQALREEGTCPTCLGIVDEDAAINLKEKL